MAPTQDEMVELSKIHGPDKLAEILQLREDKILAEKLDPYRHGYEPFHWKDADKLLETSTEVLVMGGNRAGKTEWAAKRIVQLLCSKPDARVWCLHTTDKSSIQMQQNIIYKYLPAEYKNVKKSKITNVQYSQKNGFSDGSFVLPNRSQCFFMNYAQKRDVIEGGEVDMVWCDELVPLDWLETLRYRIITRRGKMLVTFTPITGFSQVVKNYISGSRVVESREAKLLPHDEIHVPGCKPGHMPYIGRSRTNNAGIIFFHSVFNPYNPYDQLAQALSGKNKYEVKIRAYGWAESLAGAQFPRFGEPHIVKGDSIPREGTNYMVCDPAGSRNWFMLWFRVDKDDNRYIYREWPDQSIGEWALPSEKADGKAGSAQRNGAGMGIAEIQQLIKDLEGEEEIVERYIDPRAGATKAAALEGGISVVELLSSGEHGMDFTPASGINIDQGVAIVNDWLFYDQSKPVNYLNQPKLFVSENCENLIYCMKEWTGQDGDKGATKDPIDCLRYLAVMDPIYIDGQTFKPRGGHTY